MKFPNHDWNAQSESAKITNWTWTLNTEWSGLHVLHTPWHEFFQHSKPFSLHLFHPFYLSGVPSQTQMIWPHILTAQEHISVTAITTLSVKWKVSTTVASLWGDPRWYQFRIVLSCWLERCRLWDGMIPDDISEPSWRATQLQVKPGSREGAYHHRQCPAFEF